MTKPPKVRLRTAEPLQDYYNDREGNSYSVARLIDDAKELPVFEGPLASLDWASRIWEDCNMLSRAFHVKKCEDADLNCPILLDWNGGIADGRHRIIKAITMGKLTIKARRMQWRPEPDRLADEP